MASQFNESFHSQIFAMLGNPGCATCHGNHEIVETGDELLGLQEGAVCSRCHSESSSGGRVAAEMRGLIDTLRVEVFRADSILSRAEHAGMEVSQALREKVGFKGVFRTTNMPRLLTESVRRVKSLACLHTLAQYNQPVTPDLVLFRKITERIPGVEILDRADEPAKLRAIKSRSEVAMSR